MASSCGKCGVRLAGPELTGLVQGFPRMCRSSTFPRGAAHCSQASYLDRSIPEALDKEIRALAQTRTHLLTTCVVQGVPFAASAASALPRAVYLIPKPKLLYLDWSASGPEQSLQILLPSGNMALSAAEAPGRASPSASARSNSE